MSDLEEARTLFEAAERDLSALRGMHDSSIFADEIFGFHAQQAAEKFLKDDSQLPLLLTRSHVRHLEPEISPFQRNSCSYSKVR